MNKGIALASGDIIGILNADDYYADRNVITHIASAFEDESVDACYGDLEYVDTLLTGKVFRYWRSGDYRPERFYHGWMPPHPTFFARRSLYEKYGGFNLALGSSADYELMLRFLLKFEAKAVYIPEVLVKMRAGGVSNASLGNRLRANKMDRLAWRINGLHPRPWTMYMKPLSKLNQFFRRRALQT
jgi:glycosyltransferase